MVLKPAMPDKGQFVAVWEFDGKMWADTLRWHEGVLQEYKPSTKFEDESWDEVLDHDFYKNNSALFLS